MFEYGTVLWLIPCLPLAAAVLCTLMSQSRLGARYAHLPCILGAAGACVFAFVALLYIAPSQTPSVGYTWFSIGDVNVGATLTLDGLSAIMLVTVTFIGTFIAVYSAGYMHDDPGYARFFAEVSLFLFSMTGLVLADNFILVYAFWEGVGVCSYLLIGFWFTRPSAAAAARKAFLVTRLGDLGFFIGILTIFGLFKYGRTSPHEGQLLHSLNFHDVFLHAGSQEPWLLVTVCLLLFCGAVGKSAQFPLHVWLPDAMEGPTPVSALIHAATMVTAGVYLVARCTPLFALAPEAQMVVACIGAFTALLAALMAITQTDLKRVMAYSTISQLGYMFLALGCGLRGEHLTAFSVTAAIFHLFTHAFFKALLFLASGSVMHAMGGVIDMRRFSGLRHVLPITHWTFLCGALALSGAPFFSGFWSKDEILEADLHVGGSEAAGHSLYTVLFISALVTAGITAFYTFRAYFLTFWGEQRIPEEAGHHAHESPPVMTVPLIVLAVGAVGVGFVVGPLTHWFGDFLQQNWVRRLPGSGYGQTELGHSLNWPLLLGSSAFALGGILVAWWMYVARPTLPGKLAHAMPGPYELSRNRFYLDELYDVFIVKPLSGFAHFCRVFDAYVVDGLVDLCGRVPGFVGAILRPLQNGLVQFYALLMILGMAGFMLVVLLR
jgi:NADH-quinone oxidoreductase subunit L